MNLSQSPQKANHRLVNMNPSIDLAQLSSMDDLHDALSLRGMVAGWDKKSRPLFTEEMHSEFESRQWHYSEVRAALQSAGRLVSTEQAERRNAILLNPRAGHDVETLNTLICAYQSILPGEKARSHRHSAHAMRIILESRGSYSVVNGHKHPMESGDIILTPGGSWHGHGHDGMEQAFWVDCLDIPLTRRLETVSFEEHPDGFERIVDSSSDSPYRYSSASIYEKFQRCQSDEYFGESIELDGVSMPTITIKVLRWPKGWSNRPYRQTSNALHVVLRGHGSTMVGDSEMKWEFGDTIAIPAWSRVEHRASSDSMIVSLSDENLQRWAHFYRFEAMA